MDIVLQLVGAVFVGLLVGATTWSQSEADLVLASSAPNPIKSLYKLQPTPNFLRIALGGPVIITTIVVLAIYVLWTSEAEREFVPAGFLFLVYAMGGVVGYQLRRRFVQLYFGRDA